MFLRVLRGAVVFLASAVAIPYTVAVMSNVLYGWPQTKNKYKRALNPEKVIRLNYSLLQMIKRNVTYFTLYLKWKKFYRNANPKNVRKNIVYGRNDCTLDIYLSSIKKPDSLSPVVIFAYGGSWSSGDKSMYGLLCSHIVASTGAVVVCPNYSLYPKGYVDDMIQDLVDCITWVIESIEEYGGDKDKIVMIGHSAGAHLSAMAILEMLYDERISVQPSFRFNPAGGQLEELAFAESHYGRLSTLDRRREGLEDSSGSSESFAVVSENGTMSEQGGNGGFLESSGASASFLGSSMSSEQLEGSATSEGLSSLTSFAVIESNSSGDQGQEAKAGSSQILVEEGGAGDELVKAEESAPQEAEVKTDRELSPSKSGSVGDDEEEEDSGDDDDSVVTVKPKDIDRQISLADVCKSVKAFIGLAGVYSIKDHFQFEMTRGIEDLSCMCRAHYGEDHFERFSPTDILRTLRRCLSLPQIVLVHGTEDYIVPPSSSQKFVNALAEISANVKLKIIPDCDHYEVCLDLMESNRRFYSHVMGIIMETIAAVS